MYRRYFVVLLICILIKNVVISATFNASTSAIVSTSHSQNTSFLCTYCERRTCRCQSMSKILNCSFYLLDLTFDETCSNSMTWEIVDFSSRNLQSFDPNKLLALSMSRLILKSNGIATIDENTFDSVGHILTELDLQMNQLSTLSLKWLNSKLSQLKILNLALNRIESFIQLDYVHLPHLKVLNLSWNQIETFPYQIHHWKSLEILDLSFNKLSSIPRFSFIGLDALNWLSLAYNRNLSCIVPDSFKYLKSLKYLDLSSTNLIDLDGCIFIPLLGLRTLKIERVAINCSSCWLRIDKRNPMTVFGQCISNNKIQQLDSLTAEQIQHSCSKSSIDCSSDYCEPGSLNFQYKFLPYRTLPDTSNNTNASKNRPIVIVLSVIFSIIACLIIIIIIILVYRLKHGKNLFCCDFLSKTPLAMSEITRRNRLQKQKQIIDKNPSAIESIITHGANMHVAAHSQDHHDEYSNQTTSNTKRKLYNPMFTDSPRSSIRNHHSEIQSNDIRSHVNQMYSEDM